jgi:M6 family metalloprotease-like protein
VRRVFALVSALAVVALVPTRAGAQSQFHPRWEIPGFDFRKDGAWRVRTKQVSDLRRQLVAQGRNVALSAASELALATTSVTGTMRVPVLLFSYQGIDSALFMRDTAQYTSVLFGASAGGNPYTLRTFYEQMSRDSFSLLGRIMGWVRLDSTEVTYTGTAGTCFGNPFGTTNCNGIFSNSAINRLHNGLRQALSRVDGAINFAQFDNDGPDLIPNSADDDGYVDMIMFAHPTKDGACGGNPASSNNHVWSHRFVLTTLSGPTLVRADYVTNDARTGGGFIKISDYFVTSALGGATACDTANIMPIGTAAHEFGHALGLPDLYDTRGSTEGIGDWGLMGTGNYTSPPSPSRMEAWSLSELGWVTLRLLSAPGTYTFGAAPVSDTAFFIRAQGTNPRGEYVLLENRQASQADTAMIRRHCQVSNLPPTCSGGLLIWHADSQQIADNGFRQNNSLNFGPVHGLAVEEADGLRQLWCGAGGCTRGDAGDPYPGKTGNTAYTFRTNPAARTNFDGSFMGFAVDSIRQLIPGGAMALRLRFGNLTVIRGTDTNAVVVVDGGNVNVFRDLLDDGSSHMVSVADTQLSANGRTRWRFASWSDLGARTHSITGSLSGGTLTATLNRDFKLVATKVGGGTIASNPTVNLAGALIAEGNPVQLTATPDSGVSFGDWSGDTTTTNPVLTLPMGRPYTVVATFATTLTISSGTARPAGVMGALYEDTLVASGGTGDYSWTLTGGTLPQGVTLAGSGILSGFPHETGNFSYQVLLTSGGQTQTQTFTFSVSAPTLATTDVVNHLLGPTVPLTTDQLRYLDFLGNNNGGFDIGDFLAWVKGTGAPLSARAMSRTTRPKGARP